MCGCDIRLDVYYIRGTENCESTWMYCSPKCAKRGYFFHEGFKHGLTRAYEELDRLRDCHQGYDTSLPMPDVDD